MEIRNRLKRYILKFHERAPLSAAKGREEGNFQLRSLPKIVEAGRARAGAATTTTEGLRVSSLGGADTAAAATRTISPARSQTFPKITGVVPPRKPPHPNRPIRLGSKLFIHSYFAVGDKGLLISFGDTILHLFLLNFVATAWRLNSFHIAARAPPFSPIPSQAINLRWIK